MTYRLQLSGSKLFQLAYVAPRTYELRLLDDHRYLTPKLPITMAESEAIDRGEPFTAGDVRLEQQGLDTLIYLRGEQWATLNHSQWMQIWQNVLEHDPTVYELIDGKWRPKEIPPTSQE